MKARNPYERYEGGYPMQLGIPHAIGRPFDFPFDRWKIGTVNFWVNPWEIRRLLTNLLTHGENGKLDTLVEASVLGN